MKGINKGYVNPTLPFPAMGGAVVREKKETRGSPGLWKTVINQLRWY